MRVAAFVIPCSMATYTDIQDINDASEMIKVEERYRSWDLSRLLVFSGFFKAIDTLHYKCSEAKDERDRQLIPIRKEP